MRQRIVQLEAALSNNYPGVAQAVQQTAPLLERTQTAPAESSSAIDLSSEQSSASVISGDVSTIVQRIGEQPTHTIIVSIYGALQSGQDVLSIISTQLNKCLNSSILPKPSPNAHLLPKDPTRTTLTQTGPGTYTDQSVSTTDRAQVVDGGNTTNPSVGPHLSTHIHENERVSGISNVPISSHASKLSRKLDDLPRVETKIKSTSSRGPMKGTFSLSPRRNSCSSIREQREQQKSSLPGRASNMSLLPTTSGPIRQTRSRIPITKRVCTTSNIGE